MVKPKFLTEFFKLDTDFGVTMCPFSTVIVARCLAQGYLKPVQEKKIGLF